MCALCNDDAAYRAYMEAIDAMNARGEEPDLDRAMDVAIEAMKASGADAKPFAKNTRKSQDYMSAFICDPIKQ
jgi:hypothetical protein